MKSVTLNELNSKFINRNVPLPIENVYENMCFAPVKNQFSFLCVDVMEVYKSFMIVKSKAVDIDDIQPITILPYLSKVLENIMNKQKRLYLNELDLLTGRQSGYKKNLT